MVKGAVRMNAPSQVTDEAANKNSELYVGCLAIGAGLSIELEDPDKSANGKNPDVLLTFEGSAWSVAVKASHSSSAPTIFGNIKKGCRADRALLRERCRVRQREKYYRPSSSGVGEPIHIGLRRGGGCRASGRCDHPVATHADRSQRLRGAVFDEEGPPARRVRWAKLPCRPMWCLNAYSFR